MLGKNRKCRKKSETLFVVPELVMEKSPRIISAKIPNVFSKVKWVLILISFRWPVGRSGFGVEVLVILGKKGSKLGCAMIHDLNWVLLQKQKKR